MPKVSPIQNNFSGGELNPRLLGRSDAERYKTALDRCLNYIPTLQGPLDRRPGIYFDWPAKFGNKKCRLIPFVFSNAQKFKLEFGDGYIRFFQNNALITGTPKTITAATATNPVVVTAVGHGFSNGDRVAVTGVRGMTQLNNREFTIANKTTDTFELSGVNGSGYTAYSAGGSAAVPYEISSDYAEADLFGIKYAQNADILYLAHPSYPPAKLQRFSNTSWVLEDLRFVDGPYLPEFLQRDEDPDNQVLLFPGAATGNGVTLESLVIWSITDAIDNGAGLVRLEIDSDGVDLRDYFKSGDMVFIDSVGGTTEANGDWFVTAADATHLDLIGSTFSNAYTSGGTLAFGVFRSTDVNRLIRLKEGSTWGVARIKTITDSAHVTIDIINTLTNGNNKSVFRLGAWSETTGYPNAITFYEDRLVFGGSPAQRLDGSVTGNYENFSPSSLAGTVVASSALSFVLNAEDVNAIKWLKSDERGLLSGTAGNEWVIKPSTQNEALSPTNITAKPATNYGSKDVDALRVGKATLFVQSSGRMLREFQYFYTVDGFQAPDLSELSAHLTESGIIQLALQKSPQPIVWAAKENGELVGLVYERGSESIRAGWHRHVIGGTSDAAGNPAMVESVCVTPAADGLRDELSVVVKRYINGVTTRHIGHMGKVFEDSDDQEEAFHVDSGLTYDVPKTITAITKATPGVVTAVGHGFSNGDLVLILGVSGMTQVNDQTYKIAGVTTDTFELTSPDDDSDVDTSGFSTYVTGGLVRKYVMTIENLFYLEGESVIVYGDGAEQGPFTVTNGKITLTSKVARASVGYQYASQGRQLFIDAGAADGTALGKTQRTHRIGMRLHRTGGIKIGYSFESLDDIPFERPRMDRAVPIFTGIVSREVDAGYGFENQLCFEQSGPSPGTILAIMPQMVTQDRG